MSDVIQACMPLHETESMIKA